MPLAYIKPEEAFEVRIQCTKKQIQRHCDAAPENDRRDFDNRGGLQVPVYHVYWNDKLGSPMTYWYTLDLEENDGFAFDIRELPTFSLKSLTHEQLLQGVLDRGLARVKGKQLIIEGGE